MNLCPACSEPLDDFSPCACVFGHTRAVPPPAPPSLLDVQKDKAIRVGGGMRALVERKLRHRALASAGATIQPKR
jgi:hypothetical protein